MRDSTATVRQKINIAKSFILKHNNVIGIMINYPSLHVLHAGSSFTKFLSAYVIVIHIIMHIAQLHKHIQCTTLCSVHILVPIYVLYSVQYSICKVTCRVQ
jgi:hypothetical protein